MQNSTSWRRGTHLFLYVLVMLIGTLPVVGQTACPTVSETEQIFCDSQMAEVSDLEPGGPEVAWYETAEATEPLDNTTLLVTGTFYAGTPDQNCGTPVEVTVYTAPEILGVTAGTKQSTKSPKQSLGTVGICVADPDNPDVTVSELSTSVEAPNIAHWYDSNDSQTPLDPDTPLQHDTYYYVAQEVPEAGCFTTRNRTLVQLYSEPAPEGEAAQSFCRASAPILADLIATGENKYYSSETSTVALSPNTRLKDGRTYYVSSLGENCESVARLAVTVTLTDPILTNETQRFCVGDGLTPTVADLAPTGTWYDSDQFTTPLDPTTALSDQTTYYLGVEEGACESISVTTSFFTTPNAGANTQLSFCETDPEVNLIDLIEPSAEGDPDRTGTFEPSLENNSFDPAAWEPGTYEFIYTVEGNDQCPTQASTITVTLSENPNAGADAELTYCTADLAEDGAFIDEFNAQLEGRDAGGSFTPSLQTLYDQYQQDLADGNFPQNYSTIYSVSNAETGCSDSAEILITVHPTPDAGEDNSIIVNDNTTAPVDLFDALGGTPEAGGTWEPGDGTFDPTSDVSGSFTYTVTNEFGCQASATVNVELVYCPVVEDPDQDFCELITEDDIARQPQVADLLPADATWYASADSTTPLAGDTVLENGQVYYAGNADGTCQNRETVTVTLADAPNAGSTTIYEICANAAPFDIVSIIEDSNLGAPDAGGTVTPALQSGTTVFDPAVDASDRYTYSVASSNTTCPDDQTFVTITVIAPDAGEAEMIDMCSNWESQNLFDFLNAEADLGGTFTFDGTELTDGILNPGDYAEGTYQATYSVTTECGEDQATWTINIFDAPDAPTAPAEADLTYCVSDQPTGADLPTQPGENWYADAELSILVLDEDPLADQPYYLTTTEGGCESEPTQVSLIFNDSPAPTIGETNFDYCGFELATVALLDAAITNSGDAAITWYDAETGGNVLDLSTVLATGTYFAASTPQGGCESAQRLAVPVTVNSCPLDYPQGISPNQDQMNDTFVIENIEFDYPNYTIEIFNRWGKVVYKGNASTPAWDGTSNQSGAIGSDVLPVGVYFFVIDFNDGSTEPQQGKVYLSR